MAVALGAVIVVVVAVVAVVVVVVVAVVVVVVVVVAVVVVVVVVVVVLVVVVVVGVVLGSVESSAVFLFTPGIFWCPCSVSGLVCGSLMTCEPLHSLSETSH